MPNEFNRNSRSDYRAKRKKTNLVLNSLIILVLALIIIVAYNIFVGGDDEKASTTATTPKQTEKNNAGKESKPKEEASKKEAEKTKETDANKDESKDKAVEEEEQSDEASTTEKADDSQAVVSDGGSSSNVLKTIVNPAWEPVGTSQTGQHTPVYDKTAVDWQEMLNAITYATGLDPSNMTVYWLGRDKSAANASVGTVASKDKQQKYNVYIKWVDGKGWLPTKVEEIAEIVKP
ncbi:YrrS family protein [Bacillus sp. FJAT-29814]|uniref:YrrS family protein n=1 Tax=Bacillus sp. FJAT-29814 TaxID=1729688 RepID=UPI000B32DB9B|nr:YrrS family protein [Bacillus sp. FJAT-29814]